MDDKYLPIFNNLARLSHFKLGYCSKQFSKTPDFVENTDFELVKLNINGSFSFTRELFEYDIISIADTNSDNFIYFFTGLFDVKIIVKGETKRIKCSLCLVKDTCRKISNTFTHVRLVGEHAMGKCNFKNVTFVTSFGGNGKLTKGVR